MYSIVFLWFFSEGSEVASYESDKDQILWVELEHKMPDIDQQAGMLVDIKYIEHLKSGKRGNGMMV